MGTIDEDAYFDTDEAICKLITSGKLLIVNINGIASLAVNCNDLFYWGCADFEPLPHAEIESFCEVIENDPKWASIKWACRKRNLHPQAPMRRQMKAAGAWDESMESLLEPEKS